MQAELVDIRQQMAADRREADEMKLSLTKLTAVNDQQTGTINELKTANDQLTAVNVVLTADVAGLKQEIARIDFRHDEDPVQVAFSVVSHNDFGPVNESTVIPFEIVNTNVGGGWSSDTNVFEAPVDGLYQVTASVVSNTTEIYAVCHIVKTSPSTGQTTMASLLDWFNNYSSASNTVIVPLTQSESLSVQLLGGVTSNSTHTFSSFSGFLLFT